MNDPDLILLLDGTYADPADIGRDPKDGKLRHKNGVGVATNDDGEPVMLKHATELNTQAAAAPVAAEPAAEPATPAIPDPAPADGPAEGPKTE